MTLRLRGVAPGSFLQHGFPRFLSPRLPAFPASAETVPPPLLYNQDTRKWLSPSKMMSRIRSLISNYLSQVILLGAGTALVVLYLIRFGDPPYPALVPVAFWFFYLAYLSLLWFLRLISGGPSFWQQSMAIGAAAALTLGLYLAGHVGEQQREIDLQERRLSD